MNELSVPPDAYGDAFADVYDRWYEGVTDAALTSEFVAARAGVGPVLELGVGTGRLAGPIAARGVPVIGVDASQAMLDHCRAAIGSGPEPGSVLLVRADMARLPIHGGCTLALIAFNTLFNVASAEGQRATFAGLANALVDGGLLVVEALDLGVLSAGPDLVVGVRDTSDKAVTIIGTSVDSDSQIIRGQHTDVDGDGVVVRPWLLRWATPQQIDGYATDAGFELVERYADWDTSPYDSSGDRHLSVYRLGSR